MRRLVKRAIGTAVRCLPRNIERVTFEVLYRDIGPWECFARLYQDIGPWSLFARIAPECNIVAVQVTGEYGIIQSASSDNVILRHYAETGTWAKRTNELLRSFFSGRGAGFYVDVGANIGLTTIPIAQQERAVRCIAIEPDPTNYANLVANIERTCLHGNVEARQIAVFSARKMLELELAHGNLGDHRLRLQAGPGLRGEHRWPVVKVQAAPLDEIVGQLDGPLALKIDTQGAEPFVFDGGKNTIARAELIIMEWAPYWMARTGGNPQSVTDVLREQFDTLSIATGEEGPVPQPLPAKDVVAQLLDVAERYRGDPATYFDVIARK